MLARHARSRGFSLVELVVIIVILGLALTGVTLVLNKVVEQSPTSLIQTRAMELAQAYLDEIMAKRFDENTGQGGLPRCDSIDNAALACSNSLSSDSGEINRRLYDDVDDYNGLNEQPPQALSTGANLTNYDGYRVQVSVAYAGSDLGLASNRHAKRITVSITTPTGNTVPVSSYRVNF